MILPLTCTRPRMSTFFLFFFWRHRIRHERFIKSLQTPRRAATPDPTCHFMCSSICHWGTAAHFPSKDIFTWALLKQKAAAVRVCVNVWGGKQQFGAASASVCAEWPGALRGAETVDGDDAVRGAEMRGSEVKPATQRSTHCTLQKAARITAEFPSSARVTCLTQDQYFPSITAEDSPHRWTGSMRRHCHRPVISSLSYLTSDIIGTILHTSTAYLLILSLPVYCLSHKMPSTDNQQSCGSASGLAKNSLFSYFSSIVPLPSKKICTTLLILLSLWRNIWPGVCNLLLQTHMWLFGSSTMVLPNPKKKCFWFWTQCILGVFNFLFFSVNSFAKSAYNIHNRLLKPTSFKLWCLSFFIFHISTKGSLHCTKLLFFPFVLDNLFCSKI